MKFKGKIMLVDDESHIRKFLSIVLKQVGATEVLECDNGLEAVAMYEKEQPDLVVLDVNMPGIDGLETLRRIKEKNEDCVAVVLTSIANRQTVEAAADSGAAHYIRKDNKPDEIRRMFAEVIEKNFESAA